jgi:hypothetical protein
MSRVLGKDAMPLPRETGDDGTWEHLHSYTRSVPTVWNFRPREPCRKVLFLLFDNAGVDGLMQVGAVRKHVVRRVKAGGGATLW